MDVYNLYVTDKKTLISPFSAIRKSLKKKGAVRVIVHGGSYKAEMDEQRDALKYLADGVKTPVCCLILNLADCLYFTKAEEISKLTDFIKSLYPEKTGDQTKYDFEASVIADEKRLADEVQKSKDEKTVK
jgi:hypothetical protein